MKEPQREPAEAGSEEAAAEAPQDADLAALEHADAVRAEAAQEAGAAVVEVPSEAVARLEQELAEWKDRALRTAADFDNFRKRAFRERDEALARGKAEILGRTLEILDDLARVAHLEPAQASAESLHEGMLAIERKFLKTLELAGVERIDPVGAPFDPNTQEAVTTMPAASAEADQTVGMVFQHGYAFGGMLLRPARVAVLQWTPPADAGAPDA